jgi:hypothetical protein
MSETSIMNNAQTKYITAAFKNSSMCGGADILQTHVIKQRYLCFQLGKPKSFNHARLGGGWSSPAE